MLEEEGKASIFECIEKNSKNPQIASVFKVFVLGIEVEINFKEFVDIILA
jgi:hypothetical protein